MNVIQAELENDAKILLERAFLGKTLAMFGQDGNGRYGQDYWARYCKVIAARALIINYSDDFSDISARAVLLLDNYSAAQHGHAMTDVNLRLSLDKLLKEQAIDPQCLSWSTVEEQLNGGIVLNLDIGILLDWA